MTRGEVRAVEWMQHLVKERAMVMTRTEEGRLKRLLLLSILRQYISEHGYPPQVKELSDAAGIPVTTMRHHLASLREQGYVKYEDTALSRTLRVSRKDPEGLE